MSCRAQKHSVLDLHTIACNNSSHTLVITETKSCSHTCTCTLVLVLHVLVNLRPGPVCHISTRMLFINKTTDFNMHIHRNTPHTIRILGVAW